MEEEGREERYEQKKKKKMKKERGRPRGYLDFKKCSLITHHTLLYNSSLITENITTS